MWKDVQKYGYQESTHVQSKHETDKPAYVNLHVNVAYL